MRFDPHSEACDKVNRSSAWPQPELKPADVEAVKACPHAAHDAWKMVRFRVPLPDRRLR